MLYARLLISFVAIILYTMLPIINRANNTIKNPIMLTRVVLQGIFSLFMLSFIWD